MKNIKMMKATVCGGRPVSVGEVVEASDRDAFYLIATKAAIESAAAAVADDDAPKRGRRRAPVNRMIEPGELENRDSGE